MRLEGPGTRSARIVTIYGSSIRKGPRLPRWRRSLPWWTAALVGSVMVPAEVAAFQVRTSLTVTLASATLTEGDSLQLSAQVTDGLGNVLDRSVMWRSSPPIVSISSSGMLRTLRSGRATVTAYSGGLRAEIPITVTVDREVPDPMPPQIQPSERPGTPATAGGGLQPSSGRGLNPVAHEPDGYRRLVNRDFNSKASGDGDRGSGGFPSREGGSEGWDGAEWNDRQFTIVADATAPVSPPNVAQIQYPAGFIGGSAPVYLLTQNLGVSELYLSVAFRLDPGFQGHSTTTNKFLFIKGANGINAFVKFDGSGRGPLEFQFNMQGTPDNGRNFGTGGNGDMPPNGAGGDARNVRRGQWYVLELLARANAPNAADGTLDMWLGRVGQDPEPVHTHSYSGLRWRNRAGSFETVAINPTWGGTGDRVASTMNVLVDYMYVSGR